MNRSSTYITSILIGRDKDESGRPGWAWWAYVGEGCEEDIYASDDLGAPSNRARTLASLRRQLIDQLATSNDERDRETYWLLRRIKSNQFVWSSQYNGWHWVRS